MVFPVGQKTIFAKTHLRQYGGLKSRIIALCDAELLGKVFTQGEVILDLKNYKDFYCGEKISEIEAVELLRNADNVNIVGEKAVGAARKALGFKASQARNVKGIPHLQVYKV